MSLKPANRSIYRLFLIVLLLSFLLSNFGAESTTVAHAQETAVYINNFDGYSVSYPMDWILYSAKESGSAADIASSSADRIHGPRLNIIAFDNSEGLSVPRWHTTYIAGLEPVESGTIQGLKFYEYAESIYDFLDIGPLDNQQVIYIEGDEKIFRVIKFCTDETECSELGAIIRSFSTHDIGNNSSNLSLPITYSVEDKQASPDVAALGQHVDQDSPVALHAPWQYGAAFVLNGSYYGEGAHNDANNDHYATDWSKAGTSCDQDAGQPVLAAGTGTAILARNYDPGLNSGGKVVRIQSNVDSSVTFAIYHLQDVSISLNETVTSMPKQIGTVGETGMDAATSCAHIHLSVRRTISGIVYSIRSGNLSGQAVSDGVTITSYNGSACPGPSLNSPSDGHVSSSQSVSFNWSAVSGCSFNGYTFRIKDTSNMDSGGATIVDTGEGGTSRTESIAAQYHNRDLYWGVRAANASGGASWSVRRFRIQPGTDCNGISGTGIKLFDNTNCNGAEKAFSQTGFTNLPDFNDRAESIYVSSGWSVRVYEHNDRDGSSRCIDHSMWDLSKDYYTTGNTGKTIQNDISSVEVFNNSNCTGGSAPSVPSNFRISSSTQNSITVAWDNVSNENGYNIYEWTGADFVYLASVDANTTSFTETRGECGWDEFYQVTAYNAYGESDRADWQRGYTKPCNPTLTTPGNGSSNPHDYDLTFEWNSAPGATEYLVEWWGGPYSTMQPCGWSDLTSCPIGTVIPGNTYSWHVKARNSAGESDWSDTWSFTVQSEAVPDLVVETITTTPASPLAGQPVSFTVRIKNQGTGDINSTFYVDLFLDRQPDTNCGDSSSIWWSVDSLAAGASQDLTFTYGGFATGGTHTLHAFADTNCHISESDDGNNIRGPVTVNVQQVSVKTFTAADDGWVLESGEVSNVGGTMNAISTTLIVGDNAADKQYRSILSFNTAGLPDNAVITRVTFQIMHHSVTGTSPFSTHGNLAMDIFKGAFSGNNALQLTDFQASASRNAIAAITNTPSANWYSRILGATAYPYVNKSGVTQFRLRFKFDDNDDLGADYLRLYSGNAPAAYRPRLIIEYYIP